MANSTTFTTDFSSATDLSSSLSVLSNSLANESNPEHARTLIEKQQLVHQCEMMKIEISQKHQHVQDLKAQHEARIDELEEQIHVTRHAHQVTQFKLNNAVDQHSKELKSAQESNSDQINLLRRKQAEIEDMLPGLQVKSSELRNMLLNVHVTQDQYSRLSVKPRETLSIKELIQVSFYSSQLPLHQHIDQLNAKLRSVNEQYELCKNEVTSLEAALTIEKQNRVQIKTENSELQQKIDVLSNQLDPAHKANHANVLQKNRELESTSRQLLTANTYLKAELSAIKEDQKRTEATFGTIRQEGALLNQDKQYLTRENTELLSRVHRTEEKLDNVGVELENAKRARDKVYEELVNVRQDVTVNYEAKLQADLDLLKQRTGTEIQHLKNTAVQVYEREKQLLLDSKESAIADRNDVLRKNRELQLRHEDLSSSYHSYQTITNTKISEYSNELKLKEFECERIGLLYAELSTKYSEASKENDKISKKLEVLLDEYNSTKCGYTNELNALKLKCRTLKNELTTYEHGDDNLKDLISVLGTENISCSKEHLARKLVELSKNNGLLKESFENKEAALERALAKCEEMGSTLHHSNQPSSYLVESIKKRDRQINSLKEALSKYAEELDKLKLANKTLLVDKDQMTADLEQLLKNKNKLSDLKSLIYQKVAMTEKTQPKPLIFTK